MAKLIWGDIGIKTLVNSAHDSKGTRSFGIIIFSEQPCELAIRSVDRAGPSKSGKWWVLAETGAGDFKRQTCGSQRVDGDQLEAAFKHMFGVLTEKVGKILQVKP